MTDALAELEGLLDALPAAVDQQKLGDRLNKVSATLAGAAAQARRLRAVLQICDAVGFGDRQEQAEMVHDLRQTALDVAEALGKADDPETLRTAEWDYEKDLLPKLANLDRAVRVHWRTLVTERFAPLIGFGELLSHLDSSIDLGARFVECGRRAQALTGGAAEDMAREIDSLLAELERLQSERGTTLAGDLGLFVTALAERRATLSDVTSEVSQWLKDHQALDRFAVTPR